MATSKPTLNLNPTSVSIEIRQLEYAAMLAFYQAMHGVDFLGPTSTIDSTPAEATALGLVSYLDERVGAADNIVENLANMDFKLTVTLNGKSSEVKTTKEYRELCVDQPGPLRAKHCFTSMKTGVTFCFQPKLQFD